MNRMLIRFVGVVLWTGTVFSTFAADTPNRRISLDDYRDKMKGGWIGQMAGVGWGGPTEFQWKGAIIPEDKMPQWMPNMVNQFAQDDIYVEMTFVRSLELYGLDVSLRQAGIDFANSEYDLWHANRAGRDNLRAGIAPPDSGHPRFNHHADDIDYQIEADFSGLIAPGMPNIAIHLGEKFGRLMNYGDGLYAGQFVGGMYAEAFFEKDPLKIVEAGLRCIPAASQYAEAIRDVIQWSKENPDDWTKTWGLIEAKYDKNPQYRQFSCSGLDDPFNIDAKINGAYIVVGLLYGKGDMDQTILIATRCGQDSDCNPSSAAGVLGTAIGFAQLPDRFKLALNEEGYFSHTAYNFAKLTVVSENLVRQAVARMGGRVEKDVDGKETFVIPVVDPQPSALEQCWEPGPIASSRFSEEEMKQIHFETLDQKMTEDIQKISPGWSISRCVEDMGPGYKEQYQGREGVMLTHPPQDGACVISRELEIPDGKQTSLHLVVGHDPRGDWTLIVKADGKELLNQSIDHHSAPDGWLTLDISLTEYAGKNVKLELLNQASGWQFEAGLWDEIKINSF